MQFVSSAVVFLTEGLRSRFCVSVIAAKATNGFAERLSFLLTERAAIYIKRFAPRK
jgi:hypothetical protein